MDSRGEERWRVAEAWLGPADPNVPGPTVLALLAAPSRLSPGERLIASVAEGGRAEGVVVPRSALVLASGEAWSYVRTEDGEFARRRVHLGRPLEQGYFQATAGEAAGFEPGERIVVAGAGLLLAREIGGGAEAED